MRRALFLPAMLYLAASTLAHKAIEDEVEIPEEMEAETVSATQQKPEKAKQDPGFFENLDSFVPKEERDAMYYLQTFKLEVAFVCFFVFCIFVLFAGKRRNAALA